MAHIIADRVLETSTTTGTGALTLAGAVAGYRAFSSVCSVGDTAECYIERVDAFGVPTGEWETSVSTYSAANTLTRTTVVASSNGGAAVSFSAGTKRVAISLLARSFQWTEIASATPSGVNTVDFTGIPQTFTDLVVVSDGLTHNNGGNTQLTLGVSDGSTFSAQASINAGFSAGSAMSGEAYIHGYRRNLGGVLTANGAAKTSPSAVSGGTSNPMWRCTGGIKGLRVRVAAGNFTAGTIKLYGR